MNQVPASKLKEGETYFILSFCDNAMLVPELHAVVFVGVDLDDEQGCYFQDFASYHDGVRFSTTTEDAPATFEVNPPVYVFENVLEGLLQCSLRRKKQNK